MSQNQSELEENCAINRWFESFAEAQIGREVGSCDALIEGCETERYRDQASLAGKAREVIGT